MAAATDAVGLAAANARCSAALVAALVEAQGSAARLRVVLSPGSRTTPLLLALVAHPRVVPHVVVDERTAAFVALGLAQASGQVVATLCTSGSAAAHALPAAMEAHHAGVPLLLLTADRPGEAQGVGAAQTTAQQDLFVHHARRVQHLPEPVAAATADGVWDPGGAAGQVLAAWQTAGVRAMAACQGPFPGPVHLNVPFREPLGTRALPPAEAGASRPPPTFCPARSGGLGPAAQAALARFLAGPGPGLVYCGAALPSGPADAAQSAARAVAGKLGWPLVAEGLSGVRFVGAGDADGATGPLAQPLAAADALLAAPNLAKPLRVLQLGTAPLGRAAQALLRGAAEVSVVAAPGTWPDPHHLAHHVLEGSAEDLWTAVEQAPPCAANGAQRALTAAWLRAGAALSAELCGPASLAAPAGPSRWYEGSALQATLAALGPTAQLVVGNSLAVRDLDNACAGPFAFTTTFGRRGVSGIDGALGHLLGVGLAHPHRPSVAALGDLTFLHDVGALRLCAAAAAPLTVVVFNNGGGQIFAQLPIAQNGAALGPYFVTPQAADLAQLCKAHAVTYRSVADARALGTAVAAATSAGRTGGLWLIEAHFEPAAASVARRDVRLACAAAVAAS